MTPDPQHSGDRTALGWSAPPGSGGEDPRRDPWSTHPYDTADLHTRDIDSTDDTTSHNDPSAPHDSNAPYAVASRPPTRPAHRSTAFVVTLAVIAGLLGGAAGAAVYSAVTDEDSTVVSSLDQEPAPSGGGEASDVVRVADQVLPSVVSLSVGRGGGSGIILSSDGLILTNNHVAQAAGNGGILVTFNDGSTAPAQIVGADPLTDLAVISAREVSGLRPADLGRSADLRVGDQVVAIGSPLGLEGTVTSGIVSALNRAVTAGGPTTEQPATFNAIQTDAPINPGNSGGPLVNMSGQVIGVNSAIFTTPGSQGSIGLGFAIPIDQARAIAEDLIDDGQATHAQIGVRVVPAQGEVRGAEIVRIDPGTAAAEVDLQEGDIITEVDDQRISDNETLVATIRSYRPGDEVTLTVVRNGESVSVDVTLGESEPGS